MNRLSRRTFNALLTGAVATAAFAKKVMGQPVAVGAAVDAAPKDVFFDKQSNWHPDTCGCVIARDESDHSTEEAHWQTSAFIKQCEAHKAAGSTAAQVHTHNMSKNVALKALTDRLPVSSFIPIIKDGAVPSVVLTATGKAYQFADSDIERTTLIEPAMVVMSPKAGQICVWHPDATASTRQAIFDALEKHPHADLVMADDAMTADVLAALDKYATAARKDDLQKPVVFDLKGDGSVEIATALVAVVSDAVADGD